MILLKQIRPVFPGKYFSHGVFGVRNYVPLFFGGVNVVDVDEDGCFLHIAKMVVYGGIKHPHGG
jgi:hypothetical protein